MCTNQILSTTSKSILKWLKILFVDTDLSSFFEKLDKNFRLCLYAYRKVDRNHRTQNCILL